MIIMKYIIINNQDSINMTALLESITLITTREGQSDILYNTKWWRDKNLANCNELVLSSTRQMLAASWGEPEACQHRMVLFCAIDYS